MKLKTKDFLNILFDQTPRYIIKKVESNKEVKNQGFLASYSFHYSSFSSTDQFSFYINQKAREFLFNLNNKYLNKEVNNNVLENYLQKTIQTLESFQFVNFEKEEKPCPKEYSIISSEKVGMVNDYKDLQEDFILSEFFDFNRIRYDLLIYFKDELNSLLNSNPLTFSNHTKIQTAFSVGDLSLLFRLLNDENILEPKHSTELYRFLASNFKSKSSENISEKSIKNKYLSPDNTAIKNIDILLINLRQQLNKIQ